MCNSLSRNYPAYFCSQRNYGIVEQRYRGFSVHRGTVPLEDCGWVLAGRRKGSACWCGMDTQYMAASKKIRMKAEMNIRLTPQVDFTAAVMMGAHADRTSFDGAHSCTLATAPWLPLHWQCVFVDSQPIRNLVISRVSCQKMCRSRIKNCNWRRISPPRTCRRMTANRPAFCTDR